MAVPLLLRWPDRQPAHEPLLARLAPDKVYGSEPIPGAITDGLWPGIRSAGSRGDADVASASREPWVDASGFLAAYHRALGNNPLLAHAHTDASVGVPFDSLELALVEARVNGGNFVLSVEPRYREALLKNAPQALDAWSSLCRTAAWLRANESLFQAPTIPAITQIVEPGDETPELANLLFRRGASPALVSAANLPVPNPAKIQVLVAASLKKPVPAAYAHAHAGATVVIDYAHPKWPVAKQDPDRTIYTVGKGRVVAYHKPIEDPSEFALDCIDLLTHRRRAARLWNASSAIPLATANGLLHIIQYGGPVTNEIQARIQGIYRKATLLRPAAPPVDLKIYHRGTTTEVFPPNLTRLAVVKFEE